MENNSENFSPEDSLKVIQTMIDKTKTSVVDNSFYFLVWGWLVFTGALLQYILVVYVKTPANGAAWNVMFLGFIISIIRRVKNKPPRVKTYIDDGLANIWLCIFVVQILIVIIFLRRGDWQNCYPIFLLLYSVGCYLTGRLLKFSPLVWGAAACWAVVILMTFVNVETNMLLTSGAVLLSYIIPGYLLRGEYKKQLQNQPN